MKRQHQNIPFWKKKNLFIFFIFVASHFTKLTCNRALKPINNVNLFGLSLCATIMGHFIVELRWDYVIHNENETSARYSHMDKTFGNRLDLNGASAFKTFLISHCVHLVSLSFCLGDFDMLFAIRQQCVVFFSFLFICIYFTSCCCSAFFPWNSHVKTGVETVSYLWSINHTRKKS